MHHMAAGQCEGHPGLCNRSCPSPVTPVAKQHMDAGLSGTKIDRSTWTDSGQGMHGVHRTTSFGRAGGESYRWPVTGSEAQASNTFDAEQHVWWKAGRSWSTVIWTPSMLPWKPFIGALTPRFH